MSSVGARLVAPAGMNTGVSPCYLLKNISQLGTLATVIARQTISDFILRENSESEPTLEGV